MRDGGAQRGRARGTSGGRGGMCKVGSSSGRLRVCGRAPAVARSGSRRCFAAQPPPPPPPPHRRAADSLEERLERLVGGGARGGRAEVSGVAEQVGDHVGGQVGGDDTGRVAGVQRGALGELRPRWRGSGCEWPRRPATPSPPPPPPRASPAGHAATRRTPPPRLRTAHRPPAPPRSQPPRAPSGPGRPPAARTCARTGMRRAATDAGTVQAGDAPARTRLGERGARTARRM
jgi:hypothetical protein